LRTVVTGGAGFIGSHLVRKLLDDGRDVVAVDNLSRGSLQNLEDLNIPVRLLVRVDLRDYTQALNVVKGAATVYHLAARVGSVEYLHGSEHAELKALQDNMVIDANVFRACMEAGVKRVVYASSVSVYPIDVQHKPGVVISEDDLSYYNPEGGYGWAKLVGEIQLGWMKNVDVGIARIFTAYGPLEPLDITAHAVPALIRKTIMYPREDFVVWGSGEQTRSFMYVSDCVEALLRLEEKASNPPLTVNVGSDKPVSIRELAEKIIEISGKDIEAKYDPSKPIGPLSRTADVTRARRVLGWSLKISLEEGLRMTYAWAERRLKPA
jgi:nucleoside-diphosphate-sugar epimerase